MLVQDSPSRMSGVTGGPPGNASAEPIPELVRRWATATPHAIAIEAPEANSLSFSALDASLDTLVGDLRRAGVSQGARVACVVEDGRATAVTVLALMRAGSCAPLNPLYRRRDFERYLSDLRADALIVDERVSTEASAVADTLGIPTITLERAGGADGVLRLRRAGARLAAPEPIPSDAVEPDATALLLHTSGTTARPKLVPLSHRNLASATAALCETLGLSSSDRYVNVMPLFHIHGLSAVFASLRVGARVFCPAGFDAPRFFDWYAAFHPTWYTAAPTIHRAILDRAPSHRDLIRAHPLRFIRSASSAMPPQLIEEMEATFGAPFVEAYGMTEASPTIASNRVPPALRKRGSVGRAAGTEVAILEADGALLPPGATGEVATRGANVMHGYEMNPEATSAAFSGTWFRTGDVGHLDADGDLFITGRIKDIINRGGEKIAPREVEERLLDHPAVKEAVVFPVIDERLGQDVAAAVVLRDGMTCTPRGLKEFVATELADFKVPRYVAVLDALPRGATAKLQRDRMAALIGDDLIRAQAAHAASAADASARDSGKDHALETELAALWSELLRKGTVERDADFFQLGGDSILAIRLLARVHDTFGVELPMLSLFEEASTVAGMAREIGEAQGTVSTGTPIPHLPRDADAPLSFAQEGLWFADQLDPGHPVYNVYRALRLAGPLDVGALGRALDEIVRRHEALRTRFPARAGRGSRVVAPELHIALPVVDVVGGDVEAELSARAIRLAAESMDVGAGPLLRATLLRVTGADHLLVIVAHHIIADAWSLQVLLYELATLYGDFAAGRSPSLPPLPIQDRDFAAWQRDVQSRGYERDLDYWRAQLADAPARLALPLDHPRPRAMSFRGARQPVVVTRVVAERVRALAQAHGVTPFMVLLAAYGALLRQRSGQDDILVGTPIAGRTRVETETLIGAFLNTLVFRIDASGSPRFVDLLARVRATVLGAFAHQEMPFNRLVEAMRVQRDLGRSPLLHVKFRLQNVPAAPLAFPGLDARLLDLDYGFVKGDLGLELVERDGALEGFFEYSTDLFDAPTVGRMARDFLALLDAACADPTARLVSLLGSDSPPSDSRPMTTPGSIPGSPRAFKGARRAAVSVSSDSLVRTTPMRDGESFPIVVEPAVPGVDLIEWAAANPSQVDSLLLAHKAILFRGFPVGDVAEFERFAKACTRTLLSYTHRSTPRSQVSGDVYTSTEFPADQSIPMHNEMSYTRSWPMKLWFHCVVPAATGGETPFADSALVFQRLSESTQRAFAEKGVMYVRNFGGGVDLSWQDVFQTTDRAAVEKFCRESGIEYEWRSDDRLRTRQRCQGVARHPVTGEMIFMNQAHLFNVHSLIPAVRDAMLSSFGKADLPRNAYFGDGSDIPTAVLDEITRVYDETSIAFPWQAGDIMMLDNMRVAHGRRPFTGARKIVVAMAEAYSPEASGAEA